jgi:hypothetical protein
MAPKIDRSRTRLREINPTDHGFTHYITIQQYRKENHYRWLREKWSTGVDWCATTKVICIITSWKLHPGSSVLTNQSQLWMDLYFTAHRNEELEEEEEEPRAPPQWPARFVGREIRRRRRGPWPGEKHDEGGRRRGRDPCPDKTSHARAARLGIRPVKDHGAAHVGSQPGLRNSAA